MHKILLVGNDVSLLTTRALVLERARALVLSTDPYEFRQNAKNVQIDLVVLCHSLNDATRLYVSAEAHRRWPHVRIMQLLKNQWDRVGSSATYADDFVLSCQPEQLVRHARVLLNGHVGPYHPNPNGSPHDLVQNN